MRCKDDFGKNLPAHFSSVTGSYPSGCIKTAFGNKVILSLLANGSRFTTRLSGSGVQQKNNDTTGLFDSDVLSWSKNYSNFYYISLARTSCYVLFFNMDKIDINLLTCNCPGEIDFCRNTLMHNPATILYNQ